MRTPRESTGWLAGVSSAWPREAAAELTHALVTAQNRAIWHHANARDQHPHAREEAMRIRSRLQRLEQYAAASRPAGDADIVEIWIPHDGRGGLPPGRYPCEGTQNVLIIYEPTEKRPSAAEIQP